MTCRDKNGQADETPYTSKYLHVLCYVAYFLLCLINALFPGFLNIQIGPKVDFVRSYFRNITYYTAAMYIYFKQFYFKDVVNSFLKVVVVCT